MNIHLFQGLLVVGQGTAGTMPVAAAHLRQAPLQVVVEVAPDGAQGHTSQSGDLLVGQVVTFEPEDFHLALHVRMRMMIPLISNRFEVFGREGELTHGCLLISMFQLHTSR